LLLRDGFDPNEQNITAPDNKYRMITTLKKKTMCLNPQFTDKFISIAKIYFQWIKADKSQTRKKQAMSSFPKSWLNFLNSHSLPTDESLINAKLRDLETK